MPWLGWLEDRILLAGPSDGASAVNVAAEAEPLPPGSAVSGVIASFGAIYYRDLIERRGEICPSFSSRRGS